MTIRDKTAIVGVGATPLYPRGMSWPQSVNELTCKAILAAVADAGLHVRDIDGFAYYAGGQPTDWIAQTLGIPEIRFSAMTTSGGGGAVGSIGLAAAAIEAGMATVVVCLFTIQQLPHTRYGQVMYRQDMTPGNAFLYPAGLTGPGLMFALLTQRHMHKYGTTREHFFEIARAQREHAMNREGAMMRMPLTREAYFSARMIAEPLCLYDFTVETDGSIAVVVTSAERARDLRHPPAYILAATQGGSGNWGQAIAWFGMPDDEFASSGHRPVAKRLYEMAGVTPKDIDVALLYDHFSSMVLMQLEDYGFCPIGEGGRFVADGHIRFKGGSLPVNTHGGHLSEGYIVGMTHVREAVEQMRGTAVNQVKDCTLALVTGGPAALPVSGLILRR